jgi:hypothetical protein
LGIPGAHSQRYDTFRLILLSSEDINNPQTLTRIEHLHHLSNGQNAAVIFLLDQEDTTQPAMHPFMELHIKYPSPQKTTT